MLDQYRRDFADFNTAYAQEHYLFHSGQKGTLEIAPIYERYGHLFDRDLLDKLGQELSDCSSAYEAQRVSIRRLFAFAVEQYLENSVKELTEQIGEYEATATAEWMGRTMTFQELTVAISTERDRESRRAIYDIRLDAIEASNDLRGERLLRLHQTARSLDYSNYVELFEQLRQLDYSTIATEAGTILSRTVCYATSRRADARSWDRHR